jgi:ribA/ribD-fused uncharacterized protein
VILTGNEDGTGGEIFFNSGTSEASFLSNFHPAPFVLDGMGWASVEHYYQAQKHAGGPQFQRIRDAATAVAARALGRDPEQPVRPDWVDLRLTVMARALEAKFTQNAALRGRLLATGERRLVHLSARDRFWGRTRDGAGENRLGEMLMALRDRLRF